MYRKAAIEYKLNKIWNSKVLLLSSVNAGFYLLASLILAGLLLAWLIFGSFSRRVEVSGELVLSPHPVLLNSPKAGYVAEIFVKEGEQVKKDQMLFKIRLKRTTDRGDVGINSSRLIMAQIAQTNMMISNMQKNNQLTLDNLHARIEKSQRILLDIEKHLAEIKLNMSRPEQPVANYKLLTKEGIARKNQPVTKELSYLQQKSLYKTFYYRKLQQEMAILRLKGDAEAQTRQFAADILKQQIQKNDLSIRLMEAEAATEFAVHSPTDGRIETSAVTIGQTVHEGSPLAHINPAQERNYKLVFWIPNDAIAWIKPQQTIKVRYHAFPYEKFGQFEEKIEGISAIPASAQEISFYKNSQINPNPDNPLYKMVVNVQHKNITYDGKILPLTDGMRTSAMIFLEKRPLYQWIFLPLYSLQKNITAPANQ